MGLFDSITEYFASNTSVAKATTVPSNALERSIENLSGKYKLGLTNEGNYIKFGNSDDFPIIIEKMLKQSPVHAGIISKKSKMVSGIGIEYNTDAFKSKPKQSEVSAFIKNCSGKHAGLHDVMTHAAFQYELHGAMALLVKWNAQHSKIVQLTSLDIKAFVQESLTSKEKLLNTLCVDSLELEQMQYSIMNQEKLSLLINLTRKTENKSCMSKTRILGTTTMVLLPMFPLTTILLQTTNLENT